MALLQNYLNRIPSPSPKLVEDGDFGSKTRHRVREFQGSKALASDAVVGPMTWEALVTALGGPDQWLLRFRILQAADMDASACDVAAKLSDGIDVNDPHRRLFRKGHAKLLKYCRVSAPSPTAPGHSLVSEDAIQYIERIDGKDQVGQLAPMPHWCGIFALWAIKTAGANVGIWRNGVGISAVPGFKQVGSPLPGDVGYLIDHQHHFIVRWLWPEGGTIKVDTIEGNSPPNSNFSFGPRQLKAVDRWYSIF